MISAFTHFSESINAPGERTVVQIGKKGHGTIQVMGITNQTFVAINSGDTDQARKFTPGSFRCVLFRDAVAYHQMKNRFWEHAETQNNKRTCGPYTIMFESLEFHHEICNADDIPFELKAKEEQHICVARITQCWKCLASVWRFVEHHLKNAIAFFNMVTRDTSERLTCLTHAKTSGLKPHLQISERQILSADEDMDPNQIDERNRARIRSLAEDMSGQALDDFYRAGLALNRAPDVENEFRIENEDHVGNQGNVLGRELDDESSNASLSNPSNSEQHANDVHVIGLEEREGNDDVQHHQNGRDNGVTPTLSPLPSVTMSFEGSSNGTSSPSKDGTSQSTTSRSRNSSGSLFQDVEPNDTHVVEHQEGEQVRREETQKDGEYNATTSPSPTPTRSAVLPASKTLPLVAAHSSEPPNVEETSPTRRFHHTDVVEDETPTSPTTVAAPTPTTPAVAPTPTTPAVAETSTTPTVEETSKTPAIEETPKTPAIEETSTTPAIQETSTTPVVVTASETPPQAVGNSSEPVILSCSLFHSPAH